jgi:oligopeptide transport system ATP-binding protein
MTAPILEVSELCTYFTARRGLLRKAPEPVRAVDGVSLTVPEGTTVGIVGESGSGKSTLGRTIVGLLEPTSGTVRYRGTDSRQIPSRKYHAEVQYVFQDPQSSLNPRKTVRQTLDTPLRLVRRMDAARRRERVAELMDLVGLRAEFADRYPHEFSGGQRQRIGIARALTVEPRVVILDEPVSALDVSIQAQVLSLLRDLQRKLGLTYLFISHDLAVVEHLADQVAVMYHGRLVEVADRDRIFVAPRHPYTRTLLAAVPVPGKKTPRRGPVAVRQRSGGSDGCAFAPRCDLAVDRCFAEAPPMYGAGPEHQAACFFADGAPAAQHT